MDLEAASTDVEEAKRALREAMRVRRRAVTAAEAAAAGARAAATLAPLLDGLRGVALLYAPLPGEVDTRAIEALLRGRGVAVAWPRVDGDRLALHRAALADLLPGRFGVHEPPPAAPAVAADEVALAVVPGLAFDRAGARLGFGRGYYDRLLAAAPRALRVGLCFSHQWVERVPAAAHDVRCHHVLVADAGALHATLPFKEANP